MKYMSIVEYKIANANCDKCGKLLSDKAGEMTSIKEVKSNMRWIEKDGEVLCDSCK